jgi:hypothetical protein
MGMTVKTAMSVERRSWAMTSAYQYGGLVSAAAPASIFAAITAYASAHAWSYSTPHCSPANCRIASIRAPPTTS